MRRVYDEHWAQIEGVKSDLTVKPAERIIPSDNLVCYLISENENELAKKLLLEMAWSEGSKHEFALRMLDANDPNIKKINEKMVNT